MPNPRPKLFRLKFYADPHNPFVTDWSELPREVFRTIDRLTEEDVKMTIKRQSPLAWPAGEARTPPLQRQGKSLFSTTVDRTLDQLETELRRFRASNIILSIDLPFRGKLADTAACLFFDLPGNRATAICCDLYLKQDDNIRAIYKIVCAMRDIERFGGQNLSQKSFTGFAALPPPLDIWKLLGISKGVGEALSMKMRREFVMDAFRSRAKEGHNAGKDMAALIEARDEALRQLGVV